MVWTVLESFGVSGLSILGLIVVARYVSPAEMGVAAMAQGIVQLLNIPVEFLFMDALIRQKHADEIDYDTAHVASVVMGLVLSLACWLFSGTLSGWMHVPEMAPVFSWMSLSIAAMGFGAVIVARQRREMEFRALALRSFAGRLAGVSIGIAVALMGGGVWSLVAQQVLMVSCATLVLWIQCRARPSFRFSYTHFRGLASFGVRTIAAAWLNLSVQRLFTVSVGVAFSTSAAGFLNLAFRVVDILRDIVDNAVTQLALPMFSRHTDDTAQLRKIYDIAVKFTCAVTFPLFIGLAVCAPDFIRLVFGAQWEPSVPYVMLLSVLTLVHFSRLYSKSLLTACGYPHLPMMPDLAALVAVVAGMVLIGHVSLEWAAAVWALRLAAYVPVDMFNLRRVVQLTYLEQLHGVFMPLLAVTLMAAATLGAGALLPETWNPVLHIAVKACLGAVIYAVTLWLLDRGRIRDLADFALTALNRKKSEA